MRKIALALSACIVILALAIPAFAVLTTDNTNIGNDPAYGPVFSTFWRTGSDYSLLTDGLGTYLNAPANNGTIFFRGANCTPSCTNGVTDPDGHTSHAYIDQYSNLVVGGRVLAGSLRAGIGSFVATAIGVRAQGLTAFSIDTSNPLTVQGVNSTIVAYVDYLGNITISDDAYKPYGGSWVATSDERTKKNVRDYSDGLAALRPVHVVSYEYNGLAETPVDGKRGVGVIAQELEKVHPEMIVHRKMKLHKEDVDTTDVLAVDPSDFTPMLINAVRELEHRVEVLEERCK